ncbi:uncharacterized protein LOC115482791 [Drosophila hydei]|uniref:Uncharacterized protein LOC115482791 n=1 Tax=Drosophila hydei TaxID=7224 RepID=A0A6J2SNQ4_DROHY|nr:uncharacterized protein LOC115482791 [Drosophila hydei]
MSNLRNLSIEEHQELDSWLVGKKIVLNHRTRRDLSDVVNMALLFKDVVGKLVNMKNYTSHGKLALKLLNWETFSLKVLRKTGLILSRPSLELLASGDLNAICSLLFHLMRIERDGIQFSSRRASPVKGQPPSSQSLDNVDADAVQQASPKITHSQSSTQTSNDPQMSLTDDKSNNINVTETPTQSQMDLQAMAASAQMSHNLSVACANYEEQLRINEKKELYIMSLDQKVQYLQKIILEKEKRINQLLDHLSTLSVRIISMQTSIADEPLQLKNQYLANE